jgi:Flp pilus assembly protein TadD
MRRRRAESLFHRAVAADGDHALAFWGLCRVLYDRGQYGRAVRHCRKAVAAAPRDASYRIRRGDAYYKRFRYAEARRPYGKARELGSKHASGRLAKVADKLGKRRDK